MGNHRRGRSADSSGSCLTGFLLHRVRPASRMDYTWLHMDGLLGVMHHLNPDGHASVQFPMRLLLWMPSFYRLHWRASSQKTLAEARQSQSTTAPQARGRCSPRCSNMISRSPVPPWLSGHHKVAPICHFRPRSDQPAPAQGHLRPRKEPPAYPAEQSR